MRALGFDPGINASAWAMVDDQGYVTCGLIRNDSRDSNGWVKCGRMMELLEEIISEQNIRDIDVWVCEGQYTTFGRNNDHNVRLAWISAAVYSSGKASERLIAIPSKWTKGKPKELRHPDLLRLVQPLDRWTWVGKEAPPSLLHNVYDAVGLAVWGIEQQGNKVEYII